MSSWTITIRRPRPTPAPPPIDRRVTYAPHIRGRITYIGKGRYAMRVLSHDQVIAYDSPYPTLEHAIHETERVVTAARVSWMYGFGKRNLVG